MTKRARTIRIEVASALLALEAKLHDKVPIASWTGNDQRVANSMREAHNILLGNPSSADV